MHQKILQFLKNQKLASVCCVDVDGRPYCFNCYFVFEDKDKMLYFKSSPSAHHCLMMSRFPNVAGTILHNRLNLLSMQGLQFTGRGAATKGDLSPMVAKEYRRNHPLASLMSGEMWGIALDTIKLTDNSKGFIQKIIWKRETLT